MLNIKPMDIENMSFKIISQELKEIYNKKIDPENKLVLKRVIHTTADFEYADTLYFSENAVKIAIEALKNGADIVTDTTMVKAGINKKILADLGGETHCFIADDDVFLRAKEQGTTRSCVSMDKASELDKPLIIAVGNAPTALIRLDELIKQNKIKPALIIGVPVGFVNVCESKELIMESGIPYIVAKGRKGGSNVAAAIVNAILYQIKR